MGKKAVGKEKKTDGKREKPEESLKFEIAQELGLLDKVLEQGWGSLSAKETGRIGGLLAKRKKSIRQETLGCGEEKMQAVSVDNSEQEFYNEKIR